jgi:quercetin dioxygenase-like cupin family protein
MKHFFELDSLEEFQVTDTFSKRTLVGDKQMVVWGKMKKGGHATLHNHEQEQMFWILSGRLRSRVGDEVHEHGAGSLVSIPSWAKHEAEALEDATFVSFLSGIRQDLVGNRAPDHTVKR